MEKLPKGRITHLPTDLDNAFEGLEDIGFGPRWLGLKVRKGEYYVELGGPKNEYKSYLCTEVVDNPDEVEDGKFELIGPELSEIEPDSSYPVGIHVKVWGDMLTDEYTEYFDRTVNQCWDHIEDVMLINARNTIWIRIGKIVAPKLSFAKIAQLTMATFRTSMPLLEKVQIQMIIGTEEIGGKEFMGRLLEDYEKKWDILDAKYMVLKDEDVDTFYGCTVCQTFAPNHVCVITPERLPYCGILSFNGAKVTMEVDPHGYVFMIPKGECHDPLLGVYTGVNEMVYEKSNMTNNEVHLYSGITNPQTNCGCFECAVFYVPQLDGVAVSSRSYFGDTPLGINFPKIASIMSGGQKNNGFMGTSVRAMRQNRFIAGDGGYERVIWLNEELKIQVAETIPEELYDKIPTEKDCIDPDEIKKFLLEHEHPIVEKFWKNGEPVPVDFSKV
ncbi:MAG: CO dehydrogenase/CO-methylating acetyl-CoA synthase complex subunit beta [Thermodesulfobacteriota bacterium]|nr:CO dehydrogenase/CO-methylating acetyl-CoA synthase complex subunit beta [Thermodesulfobacteriota bacterium]